MDLDAYFAEHGSGGKPQETGEGAEMAAGAGENFRSGFATLIGRPNVGKSTLINRLVGQKVSITSRKPQTTRNRIQAVYTGTDGQIVFLDTPGINRAKNKLGNYMLRAAEGTLRDVDVILWLVEPTTFIGAGERYIIEQLKKAQGHTPVILVINKTDTVKKDEVYPAIDAYRKELDFAEIVPVSARTGAKAHTRRGGSKTAPGPEGDGTAATAAARAGKNWKGMRKDGKWGREGRGRAKKEGAAAAGSNHTPVRRRPPKAAAACSPTLPGSTIGACGLNFSVRNGKRCGPAASPPLCVSGTPQTGSRMPGERTSK